MLVGHYAAAFVAKRIESGASLGTYVLAAMLADLAWCLFLLAGIEHVQFKPGSGAANYLAAWDVPWSHSLLMSVVWAALLTAIYVSGRRDTRAARILFAVVVSHWVLDVITDWEMPLAPGVRQTFGFGLWASVPATLVVEGGFWLAAMVLYLRATRPKTRTGVLRVLGRHRRANRAVVPEHYRSSASRRTHRGHRKLRLLLLVCDVRLLDESASYISPRPEPGHPNVKANASRPASKNSISNVRSTIRPFWRIN
jgi:membrane-bound metal-dependent hydrolase YbcI (DUF457 family)